MRGDHSSVFWSHRWKNKAVGLWVNRWRIHSHSIHNRCGLSLLVCMLSNLTHSLLNGKTIPVWKQSLFICVFSWWEKMHFNYWLFVDLQPLIWFIITCCCHLVVKIRNEIESSCVCVYIMTKIEIYTSSESWINHISIDVWFVMIGQYL